MTKTSSSLTTRAARKAVVAHHQYDMNLADITEVGHRGSVVASWFHDLAAIALLESPDLAGFSGRVSDSGEGRWTIQAAIDQRTPADLLTSSLYQRFSARAARPTSRTRCFRQCAFSLADITRSRRVKEPI
jgi:6-phosphogluconate dehydrogenase (decarboxylating)